MTGVLKLGDPVEAVEFLKNDFQSSKHSKRLPPKSRQTTHQSTGQSASGQRAHRVKRAQPVKGPKTSMSCLQLLGPPVVPFYPFFGEGSPIEIDYREKTKKRVP